MDIPLEVVLLGLGTVALATLIMGCFDVSWDARGDSGVCP
jgi:hypothetical protein